MTFKDQGISDIKTPEEIKKESFEYLLKKEGFNDSFDEIKKLISRIKDMSGAKDTVLQQKIMFKLCDIINSQAAAITKYMR